MSHEQKVREFYDSAIHCYEAILGDRWHHGDPEAEARGLSVLEACEVIEERLVAMAALKAGERVLDFGSGVGGPTLHMAKKSEASFVGVTNNDRVNQKARLNAVEKGLADRATFVTIGDTDYKTLRAFSDGSFNAVTFYESVCHLPDKAAFFQAAFRILAPGGRLVGTDWLQRPFGEYQTEAQMSQVMQPVNQYIYLSNVGTVPSYRSMLEAAGFQVTMARDMFEGVKCWGSTPPDERPEWLNYEGPEADVFRLGKKALDAAREAGVFTVGMFMAVKRA
jgi:tocopherol O-methyltransferase